MKSTERSRKLVERYNKEQQKATRNSIRSTALLVAGVNLVYKVTANTLSKLQTQINEFTFDPLREGLSEYEAQVTQFQSILQNSAQWYDGTGTAEQIDDITEALDNLNDFADRTIYKFADMTRAYTGFVQSGLTSGANGDAVLASEGIAAWVASQGKSSEAYASVQNFVQQAMLNGKMAYREWINMSRGAQVTGKNVQQLFIETAKSMGLDAPDWSELSNIYSADQDAGEGSFAQSLEDGWFTSKVLLEGLKVLADQYDETTLRERGFSEDVIAFAKGAKKEATKVRTYAQAIDAIKEAIGTGFTKVFRGFFGDAAQAATLWTTWMEHVTEDIGVAMDRLQEEMDIFTNLGGRDNISAILNNTWEIIKNIGKSIGNILSVFFPNGVGRGLYDITSAIASLTGAIANGESPISRFGEAVKAIWDILFTTDENGTSIFGNIANIISKFIDIIAGIDIKGIFTAIISPIVSFIEAIGDLFSDDNAWSGLGKVTLFFLKLGAIFFMLGVFINLNRLVIYEFIHIVKLMDEAKGGFLTIVSMFAGISAALELLRGLSFWSGIVLGWIKLKLVLSVIKAIAKTLKSLTKSVNEIWAMIIPILILTAMIAGIFILIKSYVTSVESGEASLIVDMIKSVANIIKSIATAMIAISIALWAIAAIMAVQEKAAKRIAKSAAGRNNPINKSMNSIRGLVNTIKSKVREFDGIHLVFDSKSNGVVSAAALIAGIGFGFSKVSEAIKTLGTMNKEEIAKGYAGLLGIMAVMLVMSITLYIMAKKLGGISKKISKSAMFGRVTSENITQASSMGTIIGMVLAIAFTVSLITSATALLARQSIGHIITAAVVVGLIGVGLVAMCQAFVKLSDVMRTVDTASYMKTMTTITALSLAIGVILVAMTALLTVVSLILTIPSITEGKLAIMFAGIVAIILTIGAFIAIAAKAASAGSMTWQFVGMVAVVSLLIMSIAGLLAILASISNGENAVAVVVSFVIALVAMVGMVAALAVIGQAFYAFIAPAIAFAGVAMMISAAMLIAAYAVDKFIGAGIKLVNHVLNTIREILEYIASIDPKDILQFFVNLNTAAGLLILSAPLMLSAMKVLLVASAFAIPIASNLGVLTTIMVAIIGVIKMIQALFYGSDNGVLKAFTALVDAMKTLASMDMSTVADKFRTFLEILKGGLPTLRMFADAMRGFSGSLVLSNASVYITAGELKTAAIVSQADPELLGFQKSTGNEQTRLQTVANGDMYVGQIQNAEITPGNSITGLHIADNATIGTMYYYKSLGNGSGYTAADLNELGLGNVLDANGSYSGVSNVFDKIDKGEHSKEELQELVDGAIADERRKAGRYGRDVDYDKIGDAIAKRFENIGIYLDGEQVGKLIDSRLGAEAGRIPIEG